MGIRLSKLFRVKKNVRIIMLGLDNAGKTTLLYKLKLNEIVTTIPTVGFNVECVSYRNINFTIWDVGGQHRIRKLWDYYFENAFSLIFVIDSSDWKRIEEAKEELWGIMNNLEMEGKPLLVFSNKQDIEESYSVEEITIKLGLLNCKSRKWHVQGCSAISGEGIYEGLDWLALQIKC